jgi:hypothetical protein
VIDDALILSLAARVRELEAIQANLAERLAKATTVAGIIAQADRGGPAAPMPAVRVSHRRDRHGLHVVKGGAAAAAAWTLKGTFGVVKAHKLGTAIGVAVAAVIIACLPQTSAFNTVYVRPIPATVPTAPPAPVAHHVRHGRRHRPPARANMPRHAPSGG